MSSWHNCGSHVNLIRPQAKVFDLTSSWHSSRLFLNDTNIWANILRNVDQCTTLIQFCRTLGRTEGQKEHVHCAELVMTFAFFRTWVQTWSTLPDHFDSSLAPTDCGNLSPRWCKSTFINLCIYTFYKFNFLEEESLTLVYVSLCLDTWKRVIRNY